VVRVVRTIFIIAALLAVYFLRVSLTEAADCSRYLLPGSATCNTESKPDHLTFVSPETIDDSLFGRRVYARLADNANVYPEPSRGVAPVRNVGDGFLYATVNSWEKVNGETWYQINYGEYVHEDGPYIMYFDQLNSIALHGTYWHDRYGYKHSHGCVNMPILDAEWVFNWSAEASNDLWVWVHTSDPNDSFS